MTLATVNVFPDPVTPSNVWKRSPRIQSRRQLGDGLRLVTGRRGTGETELVERSADVIGLADVPASASQFVLP